MSTSFPDFLHQFFGAEILTSRLDENAWMEIAVVVLPDDRRILLVERSYRPGIRYIADPTQEEIEIAESGDLWQLWNSNRSAYLAGLEGPLAKG